MCLSLNVRSVLVSLGYPLKQGTSIVALAQPSRRCISLMLLDALLVLLLSLWLGRVAVHAQDATWLANPGSSDWNTPANWVSARVPTGIATFGESTTTTITFSAATSAGSLQFEAGAPAYSFNLDRFGLTISGIGVVNNSSNIETITTTTGANTNFSNMSTAGATFITNNGGTTNFFNASTAGTATITNTSGATFFQDGSTAANSTITNNPGWFTEFENTSAAGTAIISNDGGATVFINMSTAGTAAITNNGGNTNFFDTSTAGSATITNNGGTTNFFNTSTAGTAIITNNSGATFFQDASTAANSTITNNTGWFTEFENTSTAQSAAINNNGGATIFINMSTAGGAGITNNGGNTNFFDTATAGTATIINNSGATVFHNTSTAAHSTIINNSGGNTNFADTSTAANSNITNNNGGSTIFSDVSTAGSATIIANNGGLTAFTSTSTGGQARFITNAGGIFDISGLSSGAMTAGSIEGAGTYHLGSKVLIVGLNNLSTEVSGAVADGGLNGGTGGAVIKVGTGTLTLTGLNTYTGGTSFDGGIVAVNSEANLGTGPLSFDGGTLEALAAGGRITSRKTIALDGGGGTFLVESGTTWILTGAINGPGSLVKDGPGTLTLAGKNMYGGGTVIDLGTVIVDNAQALGVGDVTVNLGVLRADPQPINVLGNYRQNAGGTLQLNVAGSAAGQFDVLNVTANAFLNLTLRLLNLGYLPQNGDKLRLIITGGVVNGRFSQFQNPFVVTSGVNTIDLVYARNSVTLEFLQINPPVGPNPPAVVITTDFASFALTPNELAAADLLDEVQLDPRAANLISFLNKEPFANLPADFNKIAPDGLTSFYEISFSNSNIQRSNLEGRLDDVRNGSHGFTSNMKVNSARVTVDNGAGADGKTSKSLVEPVLQPGSEDRWGVWVTGFGDFVSVDGDANAKGYDFTTGGVSLGVDFRITHQLAIGVMGEYSNTWTALNPSGHLDVESGRGGLYATWYNHGIYFNGAIYGGYNSYDSSRSGLGGQANGGTEGAQWSTFIGGGYDFHVGHLTVGPISALQYTYANIDGFSENGSVAPMQIHTNSAESLRSDVGFRVFYQWQIGKVTIEPSLKAAWEHEFKYSALPITAGFAGIPGPSATFFGPNEGHNSAIVTAGVSADLTQAISVYVNYDGQLGRERYDSNAVTGGARISF